jgi:hypothetical protein
MGSIDDTMCGSSTRSLIRRSDVVAPRTRGHIHLSCLISYWGDSSMGSPLGNDLRFGLIASWAKVGILLRLYRRRLGNVPKSGSWDSTYVLYVLFVSARTELRVFNAIRTEGMLRMDNSMSGSSFLRN